MPSVVSRVFQGQKSLKYLAAACFLAIGAAGLGVMAAYKGSEEPHVNALLNSMALVGVQTLDVSGATTTILIGGIIGLGAGVAALASAWLPPTTSKLVMWAAVAAAVVSGILMLALGSAIQLSPFRKNIGPDVYIYSPNDPPVFNNPNPSPSVLGGYTMPKTLTDQQTAQLHWFMAVFENCCAANNWYSQIPFGSCSDPCGSYAAVGQPGYFSNDKVRLFQNLAINLGLSVDINLLCTCIQTSDQTAYQAAKAKIDAAQCSALSQVYLSLPDSQNIPTTKVSVGLVRSNIYHNEPLIKAPLVGYYQDSASDPAQQTKLGYGFGCGLGFAKGIEWYAENYYDQVVTPLGMAGAACGGAILGAAIFMMLASLFIIYSEDQDANWNNYDEGPAMGVGGSVPYQASGKVGLGANSVPMAMAVAASHTPPSSGSTVNGAPPPAAAVPANMSTQNPQFRGGGSGQLVGGYTPEQIIKLVRQFYSEYDPKKNEDDVELIAKWGMQNGIVALNKKLRDKYEADLDSIRGPPI